MKDRNENRSGYKKTEVGWIPEIWRCSQLDSLGMFMNGINKGNEAFGHGYPIVNLEDVFGKTAIFEPHRGLVETTERERERYNLKMGDILFVRSSVKPVGVGLTAVIMRDLKDTVYSGFLIRYRPSTGYFNLEYSRYCFQEASFRSQLLCRSTISANTNINQENLKSLLIPLPSLSEQKKIAEILTTWDEAIEQTGKLIEAKKKHKKALMQQLLSGGKSFKGVSRNDWRVRSLGELVEPISRPVPKPQNPYLSIGIRSHGKGTFQKTVEFPEKVFMDTLYRVESNDLIVNITFAWEGAIAMATEQDTGGLVSHRFPTYRLKEKEMDIDFSSNLIQTKKFIFDLGLISPGGAGRNRVLSQKDFLKLRVSVPSISTQTEIAKVLTTADDGVYLLGKYLNALERQKTGLMQKLLTGEIRVRI